MSFQRVLLLHPAETSYRPEYPPVGLGYLAESLGRIGIEHTAVDMRLGYDTEELRDRIQRFQPDLIGVTLTTLLHRRTYALIADIARHFPDTRILAGGPHVSTYREEVLRQCPAIDFGITQEGELPLLDLCRGEGFARIPGLVYREGESIRYTGDHPYVTDLDTLGFPRFASFELDRYPGADVALLTSRGCPYACIFCAAQTVIGRKYRFRSPTHVADEVEYWAARGKRRFHVIDDNFTLHRERVLAFCEELGARGLTGLEFRCPNGIRADRCDRELLIRMRDVGFTYLAFGVESGSERILRRINKGESLDSIKRAVETACALGYDVGLFFVLGTPGETWGDVEESVRLALTYPIADAKFFGLIPLPGTELYRWVSEHGRFLTPPDEYLNDETHWQNDARWDRKPVFATAEMPAERRVEALAYVSAAQRLIRARALRRHAPATLPCCSTPSAS